jgi:hypothetical protein
MIHCVRFSYLCLIPLLVVGCGDESTPTEPPPTCAFTLSASTLEFSASGGTSSISVSTASACTWSAASDRTWMSITGGATGTGPGSVVVQVAANPTTDSRSGTLTIAGQAVSVREEGLAPCALELSPSEAVYGEDPRTGTFEVRTPAHCPWTATPADNWIEIRSGREGSGNGVVTYAIDRNREPIARTGRIMVNDRAFTISQAAQSPTCEYQVTPVTLDACMSVPYELTASITTSPGCTWTASTDAPWIGLTSGSSGSGSGTVAARVTDNWDEPRTGIVMVRWPTVTAGQNVRIAQAGCRYSTSVTEIAVAAGGGPGTFDVYQQSDPLTCGGALQDRCQWSATPDVPWITVTTAMPRAGDDRVSFAVLPNDTPVARTGSIVVRNRTVRITQAAK